MNVTVIGTGSFGLAVASMLLKKNNKVICYTSNSDKIKDLENAYKNNLNITFTNSLEIACKDADIIYLMTAAKYIGSVCKDINKYAKKNAVYCIGSKGIEQNSCRFVHEVFKKNIDSSNYAVLSGPSFAVDVINNEPIGFSLAANNRKSASLIIKSLQSDTIKLRISKDMIGTELCGAIKNVIAVASGIITGLGYHESTRSFLIVESMHDIKELIKALGGKKKTILSFAGIGDLLLTCTSTKSRNYSYGILIGQRKYKEAKKYLEENTVEGYYTIKSIYALLRRKKIKMPVINLIYNIIMKNDDPAKLVNFLIDKE